MLIQFDSKADAQEAFGLIRKSSLILNDLGFGDGEKIEVRYHLSSSLSELLRTTNILRKEANLGYCRALTSNQTVEIFEKKEAGSTKVIARSLQDVFDLKNKLLKDGTISANSPAVELERTARRQRKRDRVVASIEGEPSGESSQKRR